MPTRFFQLLFKVYYWVVSPLLGNRCRYVPSCSEYAQQALQQYGAGKGLWLCFKRLCRCHPWGGHGLDPVPGSQLEQELKAKNQL